MRPPRTGAREAGYSAPLPGMNHPALRSYAKGCRCEGCVTMRRAAWRKSAKRKSSRIARRNARLPDPHAVLGWVAEHGTRASYREHGCRCDECRAWTARRARERKEKLSSAAYSEVPHGTIGGYNDYRCRCEKCRAARRAYRKPQKDPGREILPEEHGRSVGYQRFGCRCEDCRAWQAGKQRETRRKMASKPMSQVPHGTLSGYSNHCCRCEQCREARREYLRRKKSSKEQQEAS